MVVLGKAPDGHIQREFQGLADLVMLFFYFFIFF